MTNAIVFSVYREEIKLLQCCPRDPEVHKSKILVASELRSCDYKFQSLWRDLQRSQTIVKIPRKGQPTKAYKTNSSSASLTQNENKAILKSYDLFRRDSLFQIKVGISG